jgi:hypothetical protein
MSTQTLRGTWEEIAGKYGKELAGKEVEVRVLSIGKVGQVSEADWNSAMAVFEKYCSELPVLPLEVTSTENLYD